MYLLYINIGKLKSFLKTGYTLRALQYCIVKHKQTLKHSYNRISKGLYSFMKKKTIIT